MYIEISMEFICSTRQVMYGIRGNKPQPFFTVEANNSPPIGTYWHVSLVLRGILLYSSNLIHINKSTPEQVTFMLCFQLLNALNVFGPVRGLEPNR